MQQNNLNFESENLVVDYLSFNTQEIFDRKQVEIIAHYLFRNFGFNSTFADGPDGKQETIFSNKKKIYQVYFRAYKYSEIYWDGIKIDFPGSNGQHFYNLIARNKVNWQVLSPQKSIKLSRLDLCYIKKKKTGITTDVGLFLKKCHKRVVDNKSIKNFRLQNTSNGWILKTGKRGSPNYYRVYENDTEIRFEFEQRGPKIRSTQNLIFEAQIEEFEQVITKRFFKYTQKVLIIDENYTDWLIDYIRRQNKTQGSLATSYFNTKNDNFNLSSREQKKTFFRFLQVIAFSRTQKFETKIFCNQPYSIVQFRISDFMDFIQISNKNQYQRELLIQFFEKLQTMKPFVQMCTNNSFESLTIFPVVKARKEFGQHGCWVVTIAILQKLYFYNYRFFFSKFFLTYKKDFELEILLQFIKSYSIENLKKTFHSSQILERYKHNNNTKKRQVKEFIKYSFQQALKDRLIQSDCQIEFRNEKKRTQYIAIKNLTSLIIGQSKRIYFYEAF